jgi:hypothetical protein
MQDVTEPTIRYRYALQETYLADCLNFCKKIASIFLKNNRTLAPHNMRFFKPAELKVFHPAKYP